MGERDGGSGGGGGGGARACLTAPRVDNRPQLGLFGFGVCRSARGTLAGRASLSAGWRRRGGGFKGRSALGKADHVPADTSAMQRGYWPPLPAHARVWGWGCGCVCTCGLVMVAWRMARRACLQARDVPVRGMRLARVWKTLKPDGLNRGARAHALTQGGRAGAGEDGCDRATRTGNTCLG